MKEDDLSDISSSSDFSDSSDSWERKQLKFLSTVPSYDSNTDGAIDANLFPDPPTRCELVEKTVRSQLKDPRLEPKQLVEIDLSEVPTARNVYLDQNNNNRPRNDPSAKCIAVLKLIRMHKKIVKRLYKSSARVNEVVRNKPNAVRTRTQIKNHNRRVLFKQLRDEKSANKH